MIQFSWRYAVIGVYKDRDTSAVRVYPLPFVRITFGGTPGRKGAA
jgi:hypothetical protein